MANLFVRGSSGSNANTGADWNNAKQSVAGALAIAASGDVILVDNGETYTQSGAITWTPPAGGNVSIISAVRSGTSGFTWGAGATEACGAVTAAFTIAGTSSANTTSSMYVYGMTISAGSNNSSACTISLLASATINAFLEMVSCTLDLKTANATAAIIYGLTISTASRSLTIRQTNCTLLCSGSRAGTFLTLGDANVEMINPTISTTGGTKPAVLFGMIALADSANLVVRDGDLSGYSTSSGALFSVTNWAASQALLKNLKLSGTPTLTTGTWPGGVGSITVRNCDSADTINTFQFVNSYGTLTVNGTTYLTAGPQFNGAGVSWKIVTTTLASEYLPFITPPIEIWGTLTSAQTAELEFVRDSASSLTDREIWSDLEYPASASFPNYTRATSRNANPFTGSGSNQTTSSAGWTGTGGFSVGALKQKLQVAFTAAEVGLLQSRVFVGKASETVYVNPAISNVT